MQGDLLDQYVPSRANAGQLTPGPKPRRGGAAHVSIEAGKVLSKLGLHAEEVSSAGHQHDVAVGKMTTEIARYARALGPEMRAELERQGRAKGHIGARQRVTDAVNLLVHLARGSGETTLVKSSWSKIAAVARHAAQGGLPLAEVLKAKTVWDLYREIKAKERLANGAGKEAAPHPAPDVGNRRLTLEPSAEEWGRLEAGGWELAVALASGGEVVTRMVQVLAQATEELPSVGKQPELGEAPEQGAGPKREGRARRSTRLLPRAVPAGQHGGVRGVGSGEAHRAGSSE